MPARGSNKKALDFAKEAALSNDVACIPWPFGNRVGEYGGISVDGERLLAHRHVCTLRHGPPPFDGAEACHSCFNKPCVNGSHLRWDTHSGNVRDRVAEGVHNRGERCGKHKLTQPEIMAIRADPRTCREIAEDYPVSRGHVWRIKSKTQWAWL